MHLWSCIWIFISRLFLWTLNTLKIYLAWHDFNLFGFQECWFKNHFIFMISLMNDRQKNPAENLWFLKLMVHIQHKYTAVCHFGPDSDLDWDTLDWDICTGTFWTGTLWLETLWTKALLKTHFGLTHFGLSCFLSYSLLFFNFEIHFKNSMSK